MAEPRPVHLRLPAEPWRRVAARLIDAATVLTVVWVLVVLRVLWFVPGLTDRFQPDPWGRALVATSCFVVLAAAYEVVFVTRSAGQTPGKDILNIRVVRPGHEGAISVWRATARVLPLLAIPLLRPWWAVIVALAICGGSLAGGQRRSLGDTLAGTTVVGYVRDDEDPTALRPVGRHHRRAAANDHTRTGQQHQPKTLARTGSDR